MIKKIDWRQFFKIFPKRMSCGEISQGSTVIVYYLLFSMFPIIIIAGNTVPSFHLKPEVVEEYLIYGLPTKVADFIMPVAKSVLQKQSTEYIFFGILIVLRPFSSLANAMRISMNRICGVRQQESHFSFGRKLLKHSVVALITDLVIILLTVLTITLTFGQEILDSIKASLGINRLGIESVSTYKWLVLLAIMLVVVAYLNFVLSNVEKRKCAVWPGVFISLIGWSGLSYLLGLYLSHFKPSFENYGIADTFITFMSWSNLSSLLFLLGVCVNATIDGLKHGDAKIR